MKVSTRFFLVLLRLVIGWHFLFEGIEKLNSDSWSSEAYLRESSGPLAPYFRQMAGDRFIDELTPLPATGQDPARTPPHEQMPAPLRKEWEAHLSAFAKHYQLDDAQRTRAEGILAQHEDQVTSWILGLPPTGKKKVTKSSPFGPPVEVEKTTP